LPFTYKDSRSAGCVTLFLKNFPIFLKFCGIIADTSLSQKYFLVLFETPAAGRLQQAQIRQKMPLYYII